MAKRPGFQHQWPDGHCVIDDRELGWISCTAYSMAMLIDAATGDAHRPTGCRVRKGVTPKDVSDGLTLRQVVRVARRDFELPVTLNTGLNAITVKRATRRVENGRGFVLQGNLSAFTGHHVNHAIYVNEVQGGQPGKPKRALVYDPARTGERWVRWAKVLAFGAALELDDNGRTLPKGLLYASFAPLRLDSDDDGGVPHDDGGAQHGDGGEQHGGGGGQPVPADSDAVTLRHGAERTNPQPCRFEAKAAQDRLVAVRREPGNTSPDSLKGSLADGDPFFAYQKMEVQPPPAGATSALWFGNRKGTAWVHAGGLRPEGVD